MEKQSITGLFDMLNIELSKCGEEKNQGSFSKLSLGLAQLQRCIGESGSDEQLKTIAKLEVRIRELEAALEIKESTMEKLKDMNANLREEIKKYDAMRISQIELLALRNLELEKELSQYRPSTPLQTI